MRVSNWLRIVWAVGQTHALVGREKFHSDDGDQRRGQRISRSHVSFCVGFPGTAMKLSASIFGCTYTPV